MAVPVSPPLVYTIEGKYPVHGSSPVIDAYSAMSAQVHDATEATSVKYSSVLHKAAPRMAIFAPVATDLARARLPSFVGMSYLI
jgi:hypothetical protein